MSIELSTDAVDDKGFFDPRYTCDFDNSSPELRWTDPPGPCAGFAVIAEDPDVNGSFAHWVVYNIPFNIRHLPAGIPAQEVLPNGIRQGINGYGKLGYTGPCPPPRDAAHRYIFRIYLLRELPELASRPTREQLLAAIGPHVIGTAEIMGRYQRLAQKAG
ncbi:MAG: YbhB/YbcL family Raf kinase inhibitor-like protein [Oligoflexia bacterium]|nr:YbhB/YbcL family Raf kinase inhibitor-like protein [Oligoflexia bacterium]